MITTRTLAAALVALPLLAAAALCQETKIKRSELPPAVEKTVVAESKGAKIKGFVKETEGGKTTYEVEMTVGGRGKDITMDETGAVLEVEEEVALDGLPADVKAGLAALAGQGKIGKVESVTKLGKVTAYEAAVTTGKKHSEVAVGPDGKPLKKEK